MHLRELLGWLHEVLSRGSYRIRFGCLYDTNKNNDSDEAEMSFSRRRQASGLVRQLWGDPGICFRPAVPARAEPAIRMSVALPVLQGWHLPALPQP